jgi:hypothetical protein
MRAVIEKNSDQYIKGLACLALGRYLKHQSDRVRDIRDDAEAAKAWEAVFVEEGSDKESFTRFRARDPDAMMKEAEAIFERIGKEFGSLPSQGDRLNKHAIATLVADADAELYEIRNLCAGRAAPEIAGEDMALVVRWGRQCQHPGADRPPVPRERLAYGLRHRPARRVPPQDARRPCVEEILVGH